MMFMSCTKRARQGNPMCLKGSKLKTWSHGHSQLQSVPEEARGSSLNAEAGYTSAHHIERPEAPQDDSLPLLFGLRRLHGDAGL